ncbi:PadR family transcriptional regulator [bacterium]|nr:PadR family transcriptional regulator [bacterium]
MIEILILYTIKNREKTLYTIRKDIFEVFGAYTKPSIGTLHPALKRLYKNGAVTLSEKFSDGGKKSSYYGISKKGFVCFKELFFSTASDNPSLFYSQLQVRFATMGFLTLEDRKKFIEETKRKIELYAIDIQNKLNDEFLELDYFQKEIMKKTLAEFKSINDYMNKLKVDYGC